MKRQSTRFTPSRLMEIVVPVFLGLLLLGLAAALVIVGMSMFGPIP